MTNREKNRKATKRQKFQDTKKTAIKKRQHLRFEKKRHTKKTAKIKKDQKPQKNGKKTTAVQEPA